MFSRFIGKPLNCGIKYLREIRNPQYYRHWLPYKASLTTCVCSCLLFTCFLSFQLKFKINFVGYHNNTNQMCYGIINKQNPYVLSCDIAWVYSSRIQTLTIFKILFMLNIVHLDKALYLLCISPTICSSVVASLCWVLTCPGLMSHPWKVNDSHLLHKQH